MTSMSSPLEYSAPASFGMATKSPRSVSIKYCSCPALSTNSETISPVNDFVVLQFTRRRTSLGPLDAKGAIHGGEFWVSCGGHSLTPGQWQAHADQHIGFLSQPG